MAKKKLDPKLQAWITARRRHRLSHVQVQMARELGMNPAKLGGLDNHHQEPWKAPLPEFIETLYERRFGKTRPDVVKTLEEMVRAVAAKQAAHKATKAARRAARAAGSLLLLSRLLLRATSPSPEGPFRGNGRTDEAPSRARPRPTTEIPLDSGARARSDRPMVLQLTSIPGP